MKSLMIGEVARQAGIGVETVRFYEREGLIDEPDRRASGYRQFDEAVVDRLRFIREAKELGFTLKEIKELLSLKVDPNSSCADIRMRAEAKISSIEDKIRILGRMKRALTKLTSDCSSDGPANECPILESLNRKR